jgi:hypothetical protein
MRSHKTLLAMTLITALVAFCPMAQTQSDSGRFYLGQKSPGMTPQKFMPGLVSTDENFEFVITLSPDMEKLFFTRRIEKADVIMVSRRTRDGWSDPSPFAPLNDVGAFEQHASPTKPRFYFSRMAPPGMTMDGPPKTGAEEAMLVGVWYIDSTESGWSEPVYCTHGMYVTTPYNGAIYTTDIREPVGISCSRLIDGEYGALEMLGGGVNSPQPGAHPCIAFDESFIVFDSERVEGFGKSDLYVSYRDKDGSWTEAINLGEKINTKEVDFCPSLSPDGQYLFWSSKGDIYWVNIEAVKRFEPSH